MDSSAGLVAARVVEWDALAQRIGLDIIEALRADENFTNATTTRAQCYDACRILRVGKTPAVPDALIGRILGIDRGVVKRHFKKGTDHLNEDVRNGRPPILSNEQREDPIGAIMRAYEARQPMSLGEISYYVRMHFQLFIAYPSERCPCQVMSRDSN
jgi:hypothetical protein